MLCAVCIGGVENCGEAGINRLAIYYLRYGVFHGISVPSCIAHRIACLSTLVQKTALVQAALL